MIREWVTAVLMLSGATFLLLSAIGLVRLPDFYMRLQAAAKASTLGVVCTAMAAAVWFPTSWVFSRCMLIVMFVFLTAPIAAHIISRLAYLTGVPLWGDTILDELGQRRLRPPESATRRIRGKS